MNYAMFPFAEVEQSSKVILYGAGVAGRNFYTQVKKAKYCEIVCIVDKFHVGEDLCGGGKTAGCIQNGFGV